MSAITICTIKKSVNDHLQSTVTTKQDEEHNRTDTVKKYVETVEENDLASMQ